MKKRVPILVVVAITIIAMIITFQVTYLVLWNNQFSNRGASSAGSAKSGAIGKIEEKLEYVDALYRKYYIGDIDEETLEYYIMTAYVYGAGDYFGGYMDADEYKAHNEESSGSSEGIGVTVVMNDSGLMEIAEIFPDSPGEKAGLRVGDVIIEVGGEDAGELGYYAALGMLRGEAGTHAVFKVLREGEEVDFDILREHYTQLNVRSHMYEDGVTGIVKISGFDEVTADQFKTAMEDLTKQGAQRFVFDLRNNPGGLLTSITEVLDYLLPEGPIVRITDKEGNEEVEYSDAAEVDAPMTVLINGNTASAAELFTAALRDYDKAVVVGTKSYGKGTMQTIVPFNDGTALRISYRMYSPPKSENYHGVGVTPDIEVELDESLGYRSLYSITDTEDNQLQAAIEALDTNVKK